MTADHTQMTPEQARAQLAASETRSLPSARDHRIHATGTAVLGVAMAAMMAPQNVLTGAGGIVLDLVLVAIWIGGVVWLERGPRTVPRRARLWSRLGLGLSFVLALTAVLPWLNLREQTGPNTWAMVLAGGAVIATPSLIAAALIAGGRK